MNTTVLAQAAVRSALGPGPSLFAPGQIGPVTLKNRIVMPPMTTRCADSDGFVTDEMIAYYLKRAVGGVGLITVEMSAPERAGRHRRFELGIHHDKFLPGLRRLVDTLHGVGAKVSIQLGHGGGHTRFDISGETPLAPSAIPHHVQEGHTETIVPEEMSVARIAQTVEAFAAAARRAEQAGFDLVEIHAAHGYLLSQFLAPGENIRDDEFGGSLRNRARICVEVVRRVREAAPRLGVVFRINGDDYFPGGITLADAEQVAVWVVEAGAHAINVTGGHYRSLPSAAVMIPPMAMPDATFLEFAAAVKKRISVPVIAVGRLGPPDLARRALEEGKADFIALGRPLLADPEWVRNVEAGAPVRMCLACNTCVDGMRDGARLHCLVNAETGRELAYAQARSSHGGPKGKRIAVIGAGPAGLTFASLVAADNKVTVLERAGRSGGSFLLAGLAPKFQGVDANPELLVRYIDNLEARCRRSGVEFAFNHDMERHASELRGYDLVVLAAGAVYRGGVGGAVRWALERSLLRSGIARRLALSGRVRDWFYYKARRSDAERLKRLVPAGVPVIVIGDARRPGKSQQAIVSAFEAAMGLTADERIEAPASAAS